MTRLRGCQSRGAKLALMLALLALLAAGWMIVRDPHPEPLVLFFDDEMEAIQRNKLKESIEVISLALRERITGRTRDKVSIECRFITWTNVESARAQIDRAAGIGPPAIEATNGLKLWIISEPQLHALGRAFDQLPSGVRAVKLAIEHGFGIAAFQGDRVVGTNNTVTLSSIEGAKVHLLPEIYEKSLRLTSSLQLNRSEPGSSESTLRVQRVISRINLTNGVGFLIGGTIPEFRVVDGKIHSATNQQDLLILVTPTVMRAK